MHVKRTLAILSACFMAAQAHAQVLGLPVASDAAPGMAGDMAVSGGIVLGDDLNLYGGRFSFNALDELVVFGDIGAVDPDHGDTGWGIQGGAQYSLDIPDFPADVALRGTAGYASLDQGRGPFKVDIDIWTVTGGAVISHQIDEMFTVYGLLGLAYSRVSASGFSDSEVDPAAGVGVLLSFTPELSAYAEFMHIDDPWFGLGLRFDI